MTLPKRMGADKLREEIVRLKKALAEPIKTLEI